MEENNPGQIEFSFGWLALKLLGQNLYSNAWAAISELVANGFDAGAKNVYVYIDALTKNQSTIEVFDDGVGMSHEDLINYAVVGRNRRESQKDQNIESYKIMGRKGIGKLAALFLSEDYYVITKPDESNESVWHMKYDESRPDDEKPFLETVDRTDIDCYNEWSQIKTGTMIHMCNVDLTGMGDAAFDSLEHKLSNYFSWKSLNDRKIFLFVKRKKEKETDEQISNKVNFEQVKKRVAFKNMIFLDYGLDNSDKLNTVISNLENREVLCPYGKIKWEDEKYIHRLKTENFRDISSLNTDKKEYKGIYKVNGRSYQYELKGWIGIHSSIEEKYAKENDSVFTKTHFYNPIQLRLYIRDKLAVENYLNILNMTQTFTNYIEGEIEFDLLDEDNLPDIATTNRQGLNENDSRVYLLSNILRKAVGDLIRKKNGLSEEINANQNKILNARNATAKKKFASEVSKAAKRISENPELASNEAAVIINQIEGDVHPKENYALFISYSHHDLRISDFFYELLLKRGVWSEEIFYTKHKDHDDLRSLSEQIKSSIIDKNVFLFFITSSDYKRSEYCLFEGGAGWATRSVSECMIMTMNYEDIPAYLSNGKAEYTLFENGHIDTLQINRETYGYIVEILNKIIDHINCGREILSKPAIEKFKKSDIPSDLDLRNKGEKITDYMDPMILEHWGYYVVENEEKYLSDKKKRNEIYKKANIDSESDTAGNNP